jgi:hypothetical protein
MGSPVALAESHPPPGREKGPVAGAPSKAMTTPIINQAMIPEGTDVWWYQEDAIARPPRPLAVKPRVDTAEFRRELVRLAAGGSWVPWSDFVDTARRYLAPTRVVGNTLNAWAVVRERVLAELNGLELAGIVVRTDGEQPELAEHEADLAGLVRIYPADGDLAPEPVGLPASVWRGRRHCDRHALRMLTQHDLVLADNHIPSRPRAFCGQFAWSDQGIGRAHAALPDWWDHARGWADSADGPVLTVEPYNYADDPGRLRGDVAAWLEHEQLPLVADGPYPGVWHDSATLIMLRYDVQRAPLPPEHSVWVPHDYVAPRDTHKPAAWGEWVAA